MVKKLFALLLPLFCLTAMAEVPKLTRFYPNSAASIQECQPSSKIYAYFETGSRIVSATARLTQNDELLGTVVFTGASTPTYYATLMPSEENAAMGKVQAGNYTIDVYEVTYMENGEVQSYSDTENPLGSTTYHFAGANGTVLSETGLDDRTLVSYYQPGGNEGIKTYTFSKPVKPEHIYAELEYGFGDMPYLTAVPWALSDDGMTLSLDFRGMSLNSHALAYGNIFYDLEGNPTDPPTEVVLVVNNLLCTDGTKIEYTVSSLFGDGKYTTVGKIHHSFHLLDQTFATPVLQSVEFYSAENPEETHTSILPGCNMMALTVENAEVLAKANITLATNATTATITWEDITLEGNVMRTLLPQAIIDEGSENLVISLTDYEFRSEDGAEHVIKPLDLSLKAEELTSIAAVKNSTIGQTVALCVPGGVKVTLSNDQGYCFIEDENDGLMIVTPDYSRLLQESTLLTGRLTGSYQGAGIFMLAPAHCDYTEVTTNTSTGIVLGTLDDIDSGIYANRLLSFVANSKLTITTDGEQIFIGDKLPVITDFVDGLEIPENIADITGVLYTDESLQQSYLILRSENDINQDIYYYDPDAILSTTAAQRRQGVFTLSGMKVMTQGNGTHALRRGIYICNGKKIMVR